MRRRTRAGLALPVVLGLVMLVIMSAAILSSFGSSTRHLVARARGANLCRLAAESALNEAQAWCEAQVGPSFDTWDPFFQGFVPATPAAPSETTFDAPVSRASFEPYGVRVETVAIRRLHLATAHARCQGLVGVVARVSWTGADGTTQGLTRTEYVRVESRRLAGGADPVPRWVVMFQPGHLCVGEDGGDA